MAGGVDRCPLCRISAVYRRWFSSYWFFARLCVRRKAHIRDWLLVVSRAQYSNSDLSACRRSHHGDHRNRGSASTSRSILGVALGGGTGYRCRAAGLTALRVVLRLASRAVMRRPVVAGMVAKCDCRPALLGPDERRSLLGRVSDLWRLCDSMRH